MEGTNDGGVGELRDAIHTPDTGGGQGVGMGVQTFVVREAQLEGSVGSLQDRPANFPIALLLGTASLLPEAHALILRELVVGVCPPLMRLRFPTLASRATGGASEEHGEAGEGGELHEESHSQTITREGHPLKTESDQAECPA